MSLGYIESINITKKFGNKEILKNVSFKAEPSQITFLAGQNGAGKTTWIRIAIGLLTSTSGKVCFNNDTVNNIRKDISVVFDEPPVYTHLTGVDNIRLLSGIEKPDLQWENSILDMLKIDKHFIKMKGKSYSLGQRHRLAVASALIRKPKYLILDEPSIGIDPVSWDLVKQCLLKMVESGTTVILTGQDYRLIEQIANKVVILNDGNVVFDNSIEQLKNEFNLKIFIKANTSDIADKYNGIFNKDSTGFTIQIEVKTNSEAEKICSEIRNSGFEFKEIYIQAPTLEECFMKKLKK
jgi:ABC-type multidrug transport system ATPase subunit